MAEENIFMPIIDEVNKPKINVEGKKKNKKKLLSKKEILIDMHLDNTCKLVGKLNNNDIEMMEAVYNSYAMDNACERLKEVARFKAPDVLNDGFYKTMLKEKLINE